MQQRMQGTRFTLLTVISTFTWFALIAQFYLIIINRNASVPETIIRYFSYFTILTNILVACCSTILARQRNTRLYTFVARQTTLAAVAVYIVIVGVTYNIILRSIWDPQGLQLVVDELLHSIVPILFLIYWLKFTPKQELHWKNAFHWTAFPGVYSVYIFLRGSISGFYPYPFINVNQLGFMHAVFNAGIIAMVIVITSFLFITLGKALEKMSTD